jgi:phage terminase large subunit
MRHHRGESMQPLDFNLDVDTADDTDLSADDGMFLVDHYREHPIELYKRVFGTRPWEMQEKILEAVFEYGEVTVKSCHGTGKSFNAARIALAFLLTHPGCIVVTTAPTWRQVENILWRELRSAFNKAYVELGGHLTKTKLDMDDDWYAIGLSTNDPDAFQGFHSDEVLVIVDEAAGIDEPIFEGVRAITSNANAHVLYVGNPTTLDGTFYKSFSNPLAKQFTISAFDTPNFTENGIFTLDDLLAIFTPPAGVNPLDHLQAAKASLKLPYPALVSPTWVYQRYLEWGTDTAMWNARVMGEFPNQADDALLSLQSVMECMDRDQPGWGKDLRREKPDLYRLVSGHPSFGVDVARFGNDRTVIYEGHGSYVSPAKVIHQQDTVIVTKHILDLVDFDNWNTRIRVDDGGLGGGVTDMLNHYKADHHKNFTVTPVNFGSASLESKALKNNVAAGKLMKQNTTEIKKPKFANRRAEMYWNLRELINAKRIWLPDDEELANELASIRYTYNKSEQIIIEDKGEMKKRTGKSPDKADALVLLMAGSKATFNDKTRVAHATPARRSQPGQTLTGGLAQKHRPTASPIRQATFVGGMNRRY